MSRAPGRSRGKSRSLPPTLGWRHLRAEPPPRAPPPGAHLGGSTSLSSVTVAPSLAGYCSVTRIGICSTWAPRT